MAEFLRSIIPVSIDIWTIFFILPACLTFVWQLWLCLKSETFIKKFTPLLIPFLILFFIIIYRFIFIPLGVYFLGFIALFLIGTALFMIGGSAFGWIIYFLFTKIRKGK